MGTSKARLIAPEPREALNDDEILRGWFQFRTLVKSFMASHAHGAVFFIFFLSNLSHELIHSIGVCEDPILFIF